MSKRCYCKTWCEAFRADGKECVPGVFIATCENGGFDLEFYPKYCPFCGKPLGESKSQQNRLEIQLRGEDENKSQ